MREPNLLRGRFRAEAAKVGAANQREHVSEQGNNGQTGHISGNRDRLFLRSLPELTTKITYFRRLERLWRLIETDYTNPSLRLEEAAMAGRANKNHLNVLLRQTTSFTFHQLLIRYRLWKAISMMEDKNYSFLEIALETGFGSLNTFERNFRTILGTTPRRFKAEVASSMMEYICSLS